MYLVETWVKFSYKHYNSLNRNIGANIKYCDFHKSQKYAITHRRKYCLEPDSKKSLKICRNDDML